jgi:CDP-diacylglycerol--glycerol-3-phosphate 3-phosphatidyltransferase
MQTSRGLNLRWTLSNALSAFRMALAVPAALTLLADMRWVTFAIGVVGIITDLLDGYIARVRNEISDLGKILDPLADKICVAGVVVALLIKGELPVWFVAVVMGRDLLIVLGGMLVERRTGEVLPSNYPGKVAALTMAITLLLILARVDQTWITPFFWLTLGLLAISLVLYIRRALLIFGGKSIAVSSASGSINAQPNKR